MKVLKIWLAEKYKDATIQMDPSYSIDLIQNKKIFKDEKKNPNIVLDSKTIEYIFQSNAILQKTICDLRSIDCETKMGANFHTKYTRNLKKSDVHWFVVSRSI